MIGDVDWRVRRLPNLATAFSPIGVGATLRKGKSKDSFHLISSWWQNQIIKCTLAAGP